MASREAGVVLEFAVRPGETVAAGGVLASLDGSRLELSLATLRAERGAADVLLEQRQEEAAQADRDLEVARELAEKKTVGQKLFTDAQSAARVAHIRVAQATSQRDVLEARLAELEQRLADMTLRAPFSGVVVAKQAEVGEWLELGRPLLELVSVDELEVWLDVPQAQAPAAGEGMGAVQVSIEAAGLELELQGGRVVPQVDPSARTFKLVLDLPNETGRSSSDAGGAAAAGGLPDESNRGSDSDSARVTPGMSATAFVPTASMRERWTVAPDALMRSELGSFLFVARPGAAGGGLQAIRLPVEVLFTNAGRVAVESDGLRAGELIVIEGNERLFHGAAVTRIDDQGGPGAQVGGQSAGANAGHATESRER